MSIVLEISQYDRYDIYDVPHGISYLRLSSVVMAFLQPRKCIHYLFSQTDY